MVSECATFFLVNEAFFISAAEWKFLAHRLVWTTFRCHFDCWVLLFITRHRMSLSETYSNSFWVERVVVLMLQSSVFIFYNSDLISTRVWVYSFRVWAISFNVKFNPSKDYWKVALISWTWSSLSEWWTFCLYFECQESVSN